MRRMRKKDWEKRNRKEKKEEKGLVMRVTQDGGSSQLMAGRPVSQVCSGLFSWHRPVSQVCSGLCSWHRPVSQVCSGLFSGQVGLCHRCAQVSSQGR